MITFNLRAHNGNYYRGHEPSNHSGNCWSDLEHALTFSIGQAREIANAWKGHMNIVISLSSEPMTDKAFEREVFCAKGGNWFDWGKEN